MILRLFNKRLYLTKTYVVRTPTIPRRITTDVINERLECKTPHWLRVTRLPANAVTIAMNTRINFLVSPQRNDTRSFSDWFSIYSKKSSSLSSSISGRLRASSRAPVRAANNPDAKRTRGPLSSPKFAKECNHLRLTHSPLRRAAPDLQMEQRKGSVPTRFPATRDLLACVACDTLHSFQQRMCETA